MGLRKLGAGCPTGPALPPGRWLGLGGTCAPPLAPHFQCVLPLRRQPHRSRGYFPGSFPARIPDSRQLPLGTRRFVSVPFAVNSARVGFEAIDPKLERAARSLGATPWHTFRRITLPLGLRGVLTGAVLVYARSISEFGAVVILAYYPATAPVEIYNLYLQTGLTQAASAAVILLIVALATFLVLRTLASGRLLARVDRAYG